MAAIFLCSFLMVSAEGNFMKEAIFFLFRMIVNIQIQLLFIINYESYPTQIRAIAGLITFAIGNFAGIMLPWVADYCNSNSVHV